MGSKPNRRNPRGFTIMEVAVVVATVSVLAALLMPSLSRVRDQARTLEGVSNQGQLGQGILTYSYQNKNTIPFGYDKWYKSSNGGTGSDWAYLINHVLTGQIDSYWAPGEPVPVLVPTFQDPNATWAIGAMHYSGHPILMPSTDKFVTDSPFFSALYKTTRFRRPSEVVMLMDGMQNPPSYANPGNVAATAFTIDGDTLDPADATTWKYDPSDATNDTAILPGDNVEDSSFDDEADVRWRQRNQTAANITFADGHVQTLGMAQVLKRHIRVD